MKKKHVCVLCKNVIAGGDFVTHSNKEVIHSHALCYVKKSLEKSKTKGDSFFNLFERSRNDTH